MQNGGPILANEVTSNSFPDSVTSTKSGNKRYLDVNVIGGGGGGAESSASVGSGGFTTASGDFTVTPTVGTKDVVISGLPFSLSLCSVVGGGVTVVSSTGVVSAVPTTNISITGNTITFSDKEANFVAGDIVCMSLDGPDKTYTSASDSNRVQEISPLDQKYVPNTIVSIIDGTDGTYEYYINANGFRKSGLQLELNGGSGSVTVTIEATMQDDGTPAASCTYQDVTFDAFGVNNFTATNMLVDDAEYFSNFHFVKVKVVAATGGANDADWTIFNKKLY